MIGVQRSLVLLVTGLLLFLAGCIDPYREGPKVEWLPSGGTTMTYNYSGGVLSGVNLYSNFAVSEKSGEVLIRASLGAKKVSAVAEVEAGEEYRVKVICTIGKKDQSSTIKLDSPSADQTKELVVTGYSVNLSEISVY